MTATDGRSSENRAAKSSSLSDKAALLIIANTLKYGVAFVLPMLLVRLMSQGEYGTYRQLTLIASICLGLMVLGLPVSIYYFYSHAHRPTLIAQTQLALLVSGAATAVLVAIGAPYVAASMHNPDLRSLLPLFAAYIGFYIAGELFTPVMISQGRYALGVGLEVVEIAFRVATLVAVLLLGYGLHAVVIVLVAFTLARFLGRSFWLWRGHDTLLKATWNSRFLRGQLAYGLPLAATAGLGVMGQMIDKAIVAFTFTPVDYAIYAVGALEIPLDSIFQASVANVLRASLPPLAVERRLAEIARIWRESVRKLALVVLPCFVFLFCFSQRFIVTLFTARYHASVPVFQIYLLALPLNCFAVSVVPQVFGKTRLNLYAVAIGVTGNSVFSLILLRFVGLLGPAIAYIFSSYLTSAMYFIANVKLLHTGARSLIPLPDLARTLLAAALAALPAYVAARLLGGLAGLAAAGIVFFVSYALAGLMTRAFKPADVATAQAWLRKAVLMSA